MRPPGFTSGAARSSVSTWSFSRSASAPGRTRHLASGLRRHAPVPVHGASISTRSALPCRSASVSALPRGVRTCTLRAPERSSRSWIGARRRLSSSVAKIWPWLSIMAASASVLPPAPAHRSITCSPAFAPPSSAASCEPSSWISISPFRYAGSAWTAGLFASGPDHDAQAPRRPARLLRRIFAERFGRLRALALQRVDAQVERRARAERRRLLGAVLAERRGKMRVEPVGIVAAHMRGRVVEVRGAQPRVLVVGHRLGREARAVGELRDRLGIKAALARQHAEQRSRAACPRP